ncbi:ImmA/IrrE family metallo-endopeptidase [Clostridium baratii]|uniref:Domain of uncharacterized function (DUF955)./Antirestriction protein (ArdA) n=1 Tax=Clostridium baratii TaxID=1561 RepID=A0A174VB22_9CLOT|nr:ImmA/IrrE family metallo-endopeptidase [Clostridium baratii]CUQ30361.1 Domain of uncharacterised function (DUF955)./Antirestriction protein (ArdA) [Clostridium baratii]
MRKTYSKKSFEEKKKEVDNLIKNAQKKIELICNSPESLKEYLVFMSKFYKYSFNNTILIQQQFNGAMAVGSYAYWKEKGFQVNKGEKGIKILIPTRLGDRFENEKGELTLLSKANEEEKRKIEKGEFKLLEGRLVFKQGYVFDISQTNATSKDLPKIFPNKWLDGDVIDYKILYKGMENIAKQNGIKIIEPKSELGVAKGVSYTLTKEVALNPRNSQLQNVKTLLHELTHAKLHSSENFNKYSKPEKEFQAELTSYTVCSYFNIDTSEYSLRYIKNWTKGKDLKDKENLLKEVTETSKEFIEVLEDTLIKEFKKEDDKMLNKKDEKEIRKLIDEHEEWLNSKGQRGKRLDLEEKNLQGIKFINLDLRNADFKNADIRDCIIYADLKNADFSGVKINNNTKFIGSKNLNTVKFDGTTLDIIETQIREEIDKHKLDMKKLKTSKKEKNIDMDR